MNLQFTLDNNTCFVLNMSVIVTEGVSYSCLFNMAATHWPGLGDLRDLVGVGAVGGERFARRLYGGGDDGEIRRHPVMAAGWAVRVNCS